MPEFSIKYFQVIKKDMKQYKTNRKTNLNQIFLKFMLFLNKMKVK